jgi:hypothetical protein
MRDGADSSAISKREEIEVMRRWLPLILVPLAACSSGPRGNEQMPFQSPNQLMGDEIRNRISQIPYQHRADLFDNLVWLSSAGEQAMPALIEGLHHAEPKVRSSCAYVIGRIGDRRAIPFLQNTAKDGHEVVRMEVSRSLVLLGDMRYTPELIKGLDSERPHVRFYCHEALKTATGRDFGYDHLTEDETARHRTVLAWRSWYSQQFNDPFFAQQYAQQHGMTKDGKTETAAPAPGGEIAPLPIQDPTTRPAPPVPGEGNPKN